MTAAPGLAPSLRGLMAVAMAQADWRCPGETHGVAMERGHVCPVCHLALGDYVRALDVVKWP